MDLVGRRHMSNIRKRQEWQQVVQEEFNGNVSNASHLYRRLAAIDEAEGWMLVVRVKMKARHCAADVIMIITIAVTDRVRSRHSEHVPAPQ